MSSKAHDTTKKKFERLAFWIVRYDDDTDLSEIPPHETMDQFLDLLQPGKWNSFHDIDTSRVKSVEIWILTAPGQAVPCFCFEFFPDISKLVIFRRTQQEFIMGNTAPKIDKETFIFFGYDILINDHNHKFRWKADANGSIQAVFEENRT